MPSSFVVSDRGIPVSITRESLLLAAGPSQSIASALAFRLFSMALADLSPEAAPERTSVSVLTALLGQGFLDCVEFVIGSGSTGDGRLVVDEGAGPAEAPASVAGKFYFEFGIGERRRGYWPRPGLFDSTFREMVGRFQDADCSPKEAEAYQAYKRGLAERILGAGRESLFNHLDVAGPRAARP